MSVIHRRSGSADAVGGWEGVEPSWEGVEPQAYDDPSLTGVRKHELIGEAEGASQYRLRYFEVPPGGRTARERHAHDHGDELQCFEALGERSLGFVCVVGPRSAS